MHACIFYVLLPMHTHCPPHTYIQPTRPAEKTKDFRDSSHRATCCSNPRSHSWLLVDWASQETPRNSGPLDSASHTTSPSHHSFLILQPSATGDLRLASSSKWTVLESLATQTCFDCSAESYLDCPATGGSGEGSCTSRLAMVSCHLVAGPAASSGRA